MNIDDLITHQQRIPHETWASEVLCQRPRRSDSVYPQFNPVAHAGYNVSSDTAPTTPSHLLPNTPLDQDINDIKQLITTHPTHWLAGIDFGLRSPFVWLWARLVSPTLDPNSCGQTARRNATSETTPTLHILDEYLQTSLTLDQHLATNATPRPAYLTSNNSAAWATRSAPAAPPSATASNASVAASTNARC